MTTKNSKARTVLVHIGADELQRICEQQLGGVTLEVIVTHANIKITATTGEDEEVELYHMK
jgi:hypothetical protein